MDNSHAEMTERERINAYNKELVKLSQERKGQQQTMLMLGAFAFMLLLLTLVSLFSPNFGSVKLIGGIACVLLVSVISYYFFWGKGKKKKSRIKDLSEYIENSYETRIDKKVKKSYDEIKMLQKQIADIEVQLQAVNNLGNHQQVQEVAEQYKKQVGIRESKIKFYQLYQQNLELLRQKQRVAEYSLDPAETLKELASRRDDLDFGNLESESISEIKLEILKENLDFTEDLTEEIDKAIFELKEL